MTGPAVDTWFGCHGVRVGGAESTRFGRCRGEPLAAVEIAAGSPAQPGACELWSQPLHTGDLQRLSIAADGTTVLELGPRRRVSLSPLGDVVTVSEPVDPVTVQLVASFVLPFLVAGEDALVLHAAAASRGGNAVVIAGPGGAGKSSSLVGLVHAGWTPLSEDVCVVELTGPKPRVWPGPPWVRRRHGEPGPRGAPVLFESSEKTAWDVARFREAPGPTPVTALVLLATPAPETPPTRTPLGPGRAIGALAPHAVWLGEQKGAPRRLFGPVADFVARVPVSVLQLPLCEWWLDLLVSILEDGPAQS